MTTRGAEVGERHRMTAEERERWAREGDLVRESVRPRWSDTPIRMAWLDRLP